MAAGAGCRDGRHCVTFRNWQAAIILPVALATGLLLWFRISQTRAFFEPHALLARFPAEEATVLSVDFSRLRHAGLLAGSKTPLEADYKQFMEGTGFDYRRDLDYVVASLSGRGNYYIARGRFDWTKIRHYVNKQGGSCYQRLCSVQGSTPDRHISFLPLRGDALALAVTPNDLAATSMTSPGQKITAVLPSEPVWLSIPGAELRRPNTLPRGLRVLLSALQTTERVTITVGPGPSGIEARLETVCKTPVDAGILASQLRITTSTLKDALSANPEARDDELAATLTAGTFDQSDRKVTGKWPVRKDLLAALTAGL